MAKSEITAMSRILRSKSITISGDATAESCTSCSSEPGRERASHEGTVMEDRTDSPDEAAKPDPYEGGPAAKPDPYEG